MLNCRYIQYLLSRRFWNAPFPTAWWHQFLSVCAVTLSYPSVCSFNSPASPKCCRCALDSVSFPFLFAWPWRRCLYVTLWRQQLLISNTLCKHPGRLGVLSNTAGMTSYHAQDFSYGWLFVWPLYYLGITSAGAREWRTSDVIIWPELWKCI
jgi:hypothetical protein